MIDISNLIQFIVDFFRDPKEFAATISENDAVASFKRLLAFFSMIFLVGIVMLYPKAVEAERKRQESLRPPQRTRAKHTFHPERWSVVIAHLGSAEPAEWKLAVLEADNILESALKDMGYQGDSLGEILKSMDQSDLPSINEAWEAHRIRNRIAHEGSQFMLTERDARYAVGLYKQAFEDLGYL